MFNANLRTYTLKIKADRGEGTLATFTSIRDKDAGIVARAMLKRLGINKDDTELILHKNKLGRVALQAISIND